MCTQKETKGLSLDLGFQFFGYLGFEYLSFLGIWVYIWVFEFGFENFAILLQISN